VSLRPPEDATSPAQGADGGAQGAMPERFLIFMLEAQEYGLPLDAVVEVAAYRRPTPVPGADEAVEGITPLRGRMLTVIDTRRRLGLGPRAGGGLAKMIVVREAEELVGLVVDAVIRVAPVAGGECRPIPAALGLPRRAAYRGMVSREGHCLLLIDPDALLGGGDSGDASTGGRP